MALKMSSWFMYENCFELPLAIFTLFGSVVEKTLQIIYPTYLVLVMTETIHLHCGSYGSIICFWILVKKRNICFRIKNPDLEFGRETHPWVFHGAKAFISLWRILYSKCLFLFCYSNLLDPRWNLSRISLVGSPTTRIRMSTCECVSFVWKNKQSTQLFSCPMRYAILHFKHF